MPHEACTSDTCPNCGRSRAECDAEALAEVAALQASLRDYVAVLAAAGRRGAACLLSAVSAMILAGVDDDEMADLGLSLAKATEKKIQKLRQETGAGRTA